MGAALDPGRVVWQDARVLGTVLTLAALLLVAWWLWRPLADLYRRFAGSQPGRPRGRGTVESPFIIPGRRLLPDPPRLDRFPVRCPSCGDSFNRAEVDAIRSNRRRCRLGRVRECPMDPAYVKRNN